MSLDQAATAAADDDFYAQHPELVSNGQRTPISSDMPNFATLQAEWRSLYKRHSSSNGTSDALQPFPVEPYVKTPAGYEVNPVLFSTKAHAFVVRGAQLMVRCPSPPLVLPAGSVVPQPSDIIDPSAGTVWPLAGYYVYLDTDLTDKVDFDALGLLWTDETGMLHLTGSDARPTERLSHFTFGWSTDRRSPHTTMSVALIYDTDLSRLKKRKQQVAQSAKHGGIADKWRIGNAGMLLCPDGSAGAHAVITVPEDADVLPVSKLLDFMASCEQALEQARKAQKAVIDFIKFDESNQVMYFYRTQVNDWLSAPGEWRRHHLVPLNPSQRMWDVECGIFDRDLAHKLDFYNKALNPIYDILTNDNKLEMLGQIGIVLSGWEDPGGSFLLWRHQFLTEASGMFCGSPRQKEIFDRLVQPLFQGLSQPWSDLRAQCKCPTCKSMVAGETAFPVQADKDLLKHVGWRSKDLKITTSTGSRVIDLFTKFIPNWAEVLVHAPSPKAIADVGLISWWFFVRSGWIQQGASSEKAAHAWLALLEDFVGSAKKAEGTLENFVYKTLDFLHPKIQKSTEDLLGKLGGVFNLLGGSIAIYAVLSKEGKLNTKDALDLARGITDALRGGMGIGKKSLEAAFVAELGEDMGKKWAKALPKWLGVVGSAAQVGTAWMSLDEAADKGDGRAFGWAAVQYTGADIAFSGAVLDVCPEPVVTKGSGLVLNFIGGVIYLVGQIGEFATRPGAEEKFLRSHLLYDSDDHWAPGEKEQYDKAQEEAAEKRRQERIERLWDKR